MNKFFTLLLILGSAIHLPAQKIVSLDRRNNFPKEIKVKAKYKGTVEIIVSETNRKIYKVETSEAKTDFNVTVPELLKSIKLPSFLNLTLPQVAASETLESKAIISTDTMTSEDNVSGIHTRIIELFAEIERKGEKLLRSTNFYNGLQKTFKDCNLSAANTQSRLRSQTHSYLQLSPGLNTFTTAQLLLHLEDTLSGLRQGAEASLNELQRIVPAYITSIKEGHVKSLQILNELKAQAQGIIDNRRSTAHEKRDARNDLLDLNKGISEVTAVKKAFEETEKDLKKQLENAKEVVDSMIDFEREDKVNSILSLYSIMMNPRNYQFTSGKILAKNDEIRYKISIEPLDINACEGLDKKSTEVIIRTSGGLKVDFSSGLFLLRGSEEFLGKTYYWENIDDKSRKIVTTERGSRLQLGIGALMHFYIRNYSFVKPAISLGASTTADFADLNFHAGPSIIFGNKDRFIVTGGLVLKSAKVLDRNLKTNFAYEKAFSPDEIPTVSQFPKSGWFIGFTYNLSKFKRE